MNCRLNLEIHALFSLVSVIILLEERCTKVACKTVISEYMSVQWWCRVCLVFSKQSLIFLDRKDTL